MKIETATGFRMKIVAAGLAIAGLCAGVALPAASHNHSAPPAVIRMAPVPVHLLPVVTPHGASTTPPGATLV
jgi:hypothetical protein